MKLGKEAKIGLFAILMIAGLYWGVNFLKGSELFSRSSTYYATYDQVNGLQKSSAILIKGFKIGHVSGVSYDLSRSKIILEFTIKDKYPIPTNSKARIYSADIMGGKAVEIVPGDSNVNLKDGDTIHSEMDKGLLEVAGTEFELIKQKFNVLSEELVVTLGNVNKILSEENARSIEKTLSNVANISNNLNDLIVTEKGTLSSLVTNVNKLSTTIGDNTGKIDRIFNNVEAFSDSLNQANIPTVIGQINTTLTEINSTLSKVNNGSGNLGKFMSDEELYENLLASSNALNLLLEDIKENPKRYVSFSVFGGGGKSKK